MANITLQVKAVETALPILGQENDDDPAKELRRIAARYRARAEKLGALSLLYLGETAVSIARQATRYARAAQRVEWLIHA